MGGRDAFSLYCFGYFRNAERLKEMSAMSTKVIPPEKEVTGVSTGTVFILYGTHTGTSKELAEQAAEALQMAGVESEVWDMQSFPFGELCEVRHLLIVVSTDGDGEPPLMAEGFFEFLKDDAAPRLDHLRYSVLALGDSCYYRFCEAGKQMDAALQHLGASRLAPRVDCDLDYEQPFSVWLQSVRTFLGS